MFNPEEDLKKANKKKQDEENLFKKALMENGEFRGYKFQEDTYANKMAFLFGRDDGEEAARKILEVANSKFPNQIQAPDKRKFIEEEINKRAVDVDKRFRDGMANAFSKLATNTAIKSAKGEEALKETIFQLMTEGLGLNIDKDNMQTHYDAGPPMVFQVCWVNRPTKNLKDNNSSINQLANSYSNTLTAGESEKFNKDWSTHKTNALNDGPKIPKDVFEKKADSLFEQTKNDLKNQGLSAPPSSSGKEVDKHENNQIKFN